MEYVRKASKISNLLSDYDVENESEKIKKVNKLKKQRLIIYIANLKMIF